MRLWTLHPRYLDRQGLLALWREGLLAQKVLLGRTRGYRRHPQLARFRQQRDPVAAIAAYLVEVHREALRRGYRFDGRKIHRRKAKGRIPETRGQLLYEWNHLRRKLKARNPVLFAVSARIDKPLPNPIFKIVLGKVRAWERRVTAAEPSLGRRGLAREACEEDPSSAG